MTESKWMIYLKQVNIYQISLTNCKIYCVFYTFLWKTVEDFIGNIICRFCLVIYFHFESTKTNAHVTCTKITFPKKDRFMI